MLENSVGVARVSPDFLNQTSARNHFLELHQIMYTFFRYLRT